MLQSDLIRIWSESTGVLHDLVWKSGREEDDLNSLW